MKYISTTKSISKLLFIFTAVLIVATSFSALGFALMDHNNMQTCPIGIISGDDCTAVVNEVTFIPHHFGAFNLFTQATVGYGVATLILILSVGVFVTQKLSHKPKKDISSVVVRIFKEKNKLPFISSHILKWIALHNKRGLDSSALVVGLQNAIKIAA